MKKYNSGAACIKCGCRKINDVHQKKYLKGLYLATPPAAAWVPEHINRTCNNCGFSWNEEPLNKEV